MYPIGVHLIGARSCGESGEGEAAGGEESCPGEEGRAKRAAEAAKVVKEAEARRKQEKRRARKEAKEAETAAILAMRQAAKELVEKKSRNREESPPLVS